MHNVTLKGTEVQLKGSFLRPGNLCPDFVLVNQELENVTLESYREKKKVIATLPSIDTSVCSEEVKLINEFALRNPEIVVLVVSKDLPFAYKRYCMQECVQNVHLLSDMRQRSSFGKDYGVLIASGPLEGVFARALFVLNESDKVLHSELVEEITHLPNFEKAFSYLIDDEEECQA